MKARVVNKKSKYYGKIINVKKIEDTRFFGNRYAMVYGKGVFFGDEIEFNTEKEQNTNFNNDWSSFRREAAKDILAGFASKIGHTMSDYSEQSCKYAIQLADELIKQLKGQ